MTDTRSKVRVLKTLLQKEKTLELTQYQIHHTAIFPLRSVILDNISESISYTT